MAPKRILQSIRGQPRKTRRRVAPAAAAGSAVATSDTPTAPDDSIGPDADTGSTAFVTPEATLADTIATAGRSETIGTIWAVATGETSDAGSG